MCSYCTNIETGDDYNPIIASKVDFGFFGNVDADVWMGKRNGYPYIILGLCEDNGTGEYERVEQINYCPMCGRDLLYEKEKGVLKND